LEQLRRPKEEEGLFPESSSDYNTESKSLSLFAFPPQAQHRKLLKMLIFNNDSV
jgi:hypothetical protein